MTTSMATVLDLTTAATPTGDRKYLGFHWWLALVVEPNREQKSADWLDERAGLVVYWPHFGDSVRSRGKSHRAIKRSVIPGLLFVPHEIVIATPRFREIMNIAHIIRFMTSDGGVPLMISKTDIEQVRGMEAKLNLPPPPAVKAQDLKTGNPVKFKDVVLHATWGSGIVFEVASDTRIGVEVTKLFGRKGKVYVPASEIERM